MATAVDICNMSLSHLGVEFITALSDSTEPARQCNLLYEPARDQVLRDHPWGFAETSVELTVLPAVEPTGYTFAYTYPANCLHARNIYNSIVGAAPIDYKIVATAALDGKVIVTDFEDAVLIYTAAITDTTLFDASFITAFSWRLAADLAYPLTKKGTTAKAMQEAYSLYLPASQATDAAEGREDLGVDNPYLSARL